MRLMVFLLGLVLWSADSQAQAQTLTIHGSAFATYSKLNSERGGSAFSAIGWGGASLQSGPAVLNVMLSFDPILLGDCGYPRILAGAGLCADHPFQDRSHLHPLFMDISAAVTRTVSGTTLKLQGGVAGEPSVGALSSLHRASAALDPIAPVTHHDINPAHVVNGHVTAGAARGQLGLEVSAFNSNASNNNPYDFDFGALDSFSGRVRYRLPGNIDWQFSAARMEPQHAGHSSHVLQQEKLVALTSSAELSRMYGSLMLDATLGWSRHSFDQQNADGFIAEATLRRGAHAVLLRAETLERAEQEVTIIEGPNGEHEHLTTPIMTRISELAGVYALRLLQRSGAEVSAGVRGALTFIPDFQQAYYQTSRARSLAVYLNVRPTSQHHH